MEETKLEIRGKVYTAKFVSLYQFQRLQAMEKLVNAAQLKFEDDPLSDAAGEEYRRLWLEYCKAIFQEDVADLGIDNLSLGEAEALRDFFWSLVAQAAQTLKRGKEISERLSNLAQATDSQTGTVSTS